MKEKLGIIIPNRPGPSVNPNDANAANSNESKVNTYKLPDPLLLENGKFVKTAEDWWKIKQPEIVEQFDREIYGRLPNSIPQVT